MSEDEWSDLTCALESWSWESMECIRGNGMEAGEPVGVCGYHLDGSCWGAEEQL